MHFNNICILVAYHDIKLRKKGVNLIDTHFWGVHCLGLFCLPVFLFRIPWTKCLNLTFTTMSLVL